MIPQTSATARLGCMRAWSGEDYLDSVGIFDSIKGAPHRHLVSFGMNELYYDPQSA